MQCAPKLRVLLRCARALPEARAIPKEGLDVLALLTLQCAYNGMERLVVRIRVVRRPPTVGEEANLALARLEQLHRLLRGHE